MQEVEKRIRTEVDDKFRFFAQCCDQSDLYKDVEKATKILNHRTNRSFRTLSVIFGIE